MERYRGPIDKATKILTEAILQEEPDLEAHALRMDERLREMFRLIGRAALAGVYAALAERVVRRAQEDGLTVQRRPTIEVVTLYGKVAVESPYLWDPKSHRSARPVRSELGLEYHKRSEAVERALTDFGAEKSFAKADSQFNEHYGFEVGRATVRMVVQEHARRAEDFLGQKWEKAKKQYEVPVGKRPGEERMLVEMDGCELRTGTLTKAAGEERTAVRKLPKRVRQTEWREVRVGLARPLDQVDPTYVARMDKYPAVVGALFGAACERGLSEDTDVTSVGDGGNGLREELQAQFPGLRFILDRPHLVHHVSEAAEATGRAGEEQEQWVKERMDRIDAGQVASVLEELEGYQGPGEKRIAQLVAHLRRFQDAVNYAEFRRQGLPIGSGEVESSHRSVPQARMKLPGTWWHPDNVNPMLALRALRANQWWEVFWQAA